MNLEAIDYSAGFCAFALCYYNMNDDIRKSYLISKVNKYCQVGYQESSIWIEIRKLYSLKNVKVSYNELQSRVLTDFTNFCQHYPKPLYINFEQIFIVHAHARLVYERNFWNEVNIVILDSKNAIGNFNEICRNIPEIKDFLNLYDSIGKDQLKNVILKIDEWVNNNKIIFSMVNILDNKKNDISALTSEISYFTGLQKIYLSDQNIKSLPNEICNLKNLKYIALDKNNIEEFPSVLCSLTNLESINLSFNKIKLLPDDIKNLTKLKTLTLSNNSIDSINESICSLKLSSLNLSKNPINRTDLPKNMLAKKVIIAESLKEQEQQQLAILNKQKKLQKEELIRKVEKEMQIEQKIERGQIQQLLQNMWQQAPNQLPITNAVKIENDSSESDFSSEEDSKDALDVIHTTKRDNPFDEEDTDLKRRRK